VFSAVLSFSLSTIGYALDVTLEWDPRDPDTQPDLDHYVVFWGTSSESYTSDSGNIDEGQTIYSATGLSDGTTYFFAVKAYDDQGRESDYSNEVSTDDSTPTISTSGGSGDDNDGCFIATAAYSSPMSSKTNILCQFSDWYLKSNVLGKSLITLYEGSSPYLADITSKNEYLKVVVRLVLWPVVGVAYVMGNTTMEQKIMMLVIMVVLTYVMLKIFTIRARSTRL